MNRSNNLIKLCNNILLKNNKNNTINSIKSIIPTISTSTSTTTTTTTNKIQTITKRNYSSIINNNDKNEKKPDEIKTTTTTTTTETLTTPENKSENNTNTNNENNNNNENKSENKTEDGNNNEKKQEERVEPPPKTLKEKIISKIKWTTIIGGVAGSIFFLFYESYLRNTMPYKMTMSLVDKDPEVLRAFGGHITGIKWYKCFINPIFGWVQNEEGGYKSWTILRIPITRYIAPPPPTPKEGQVIPPPIELPEDQIFKGYDGGVQEGTIFARLDKSSANFFDWKFQDLHIICDSGDTIKLVDYEKNKVKL